MTFLEPHRVDLRAYGIDETHAAELRARLSTFAADWAGSAAYAGSVARRTARPRARVMSGKTLAGLMPEEGEAHGLLALMEIQASRLRARTGPDGASIPVTEQDRAHWDPLLIRRGLDALGGNGPYVLQAALAACHARAHQAADTDDWPRIAALYDRLRVVTPRP